MKRPENNDPVSGGKMVQGADKEGRDHFAARLDPGGHLEFVRGATNVTIHAASRMETTWLEEGPKPEQSAPSGRHR